VGQLDLEQSSQRRDKWMNDKTFIVSYLRVYQLENSSQRRDNWKNEEILVASIFLGNSDEFRVVLLKKRNV
jgi:hypothetical protein